MKDSSDLSICLTPDQIKSVVSRIRGRFPSEVRPDANLLLNDLASVVRPGRNWGGLLADIRSNSTEEVPDSRGLVRHLPPLVRDASLPSIAIRERRASGAGGILERPVLLESFERGALGAGACGGEVLGVIFEVSETSVGFEVCPLPDMIGAGPDGLFIDQLAAWNASAEVSQAILETLQSVWCTDWRSILGPEGLKHAFVLVAPSSGVMVISEEALEAVRARRNVSALEVAAVRMVLPEDEVPAEEMMLLARTTQAAFPLLASKGYDSGTTGPVRIEMDIREVPRVSWTSISDEFPAPPWRRGHVAIEAGEEWAREMSTDNPFGDTLGWLLSEAVSFAAEYHGIPRAETPVIQASGREMGPGGQERLISEDWRFLSWREGRPGEWRLADEERHVRMRRHVEAWLRSEKARIVSRADLPDDAMSLLAAREERRNARHWARALKLFGEIR